MPEISVRVRMVSRNRLDAERAERYIELRSKRDTED